MFDLLTQDVPPRHWTGLLLFRTGQPMTKPSSVDAKSIEWLIGCGLIELAGDSQYRIAQMGREVLRRGRLAAYAAALNGAANRTPSHAPRRRAS